VIGEQGVEAKRSEAKRGIQGRKDGIIIEIRWEFWVFIASDMSGLMAKNDELWSIRE